MSQEFTRSFRVRWSEMGAAHRVRASQYMDYLVELAYAWGGSQGLGFEESRALGLVWVILETDIRFLHPLRYPEEFDFSIWMLDWRRVRGTRAFELRLKDSQTVIAQGIQKIASLDAHTLRPKQPPPELIEGYRLENPRQIPHKKFPALDPPPEGTLAMQRRVQWGAIDALQHLNHGKSLGYVEDAMAHFLAAQGWPLQRLGEMGLAEVPRRVHVRYLEPAYWNEALRISSYPLELAEEGATNAMVLEKESDGKRVLEALYEWQLVDVNSGDSVKLPEDLRAALSAG